MKKHKLISALVALPLAIILWLYVVTVVSPDSSRVIREIPITFEGSILLEEKELIMTSGGGTSSLKITGDRVNLSKLSNENIRIIADLSQISINEPGEYTIPLSVELPSNFGKFNYDFAEKGKSEIDITVSKLVTKTFSVELDTADAEAKEGYFFDSANALSDPAEITVTGPDYEVEAISNAVIDCSDVSKLEETVVEQRPIQLLGQDGKAVELSLSTVSKTEATVSLPIQKYKELKISVNFKEGGGAAESNVSALKFSTDTLLVRGSSTQIDNLEDELFLGTIDLAKMTAQTGNTKIFTVTLPSGIKNVNGVDEITVRFNLDGVKTNVYTLSSDSITILNKPQNVKVKINLEKIEVKLRGPESDMEAVKSENILISIDLTDVTKSGEVLAVVTVDGYPKIAVLEDVFVDITIQ